MHALAASAVIGLAGDVGLAGGSVPQSMCPADLTGDDTVDVEDLLLVLLGWGWCPAECPSDLDGDHEVGVADMLEVLLAWGPCQCIEAGALIDHSTGVPWSPETGYELGSEIDLRLALECFEPSNVVFQVWSDGIYAGFVDWSPPFIYDGDALLNGSVPNGEGFMQALLRDAGNTPFLVLEFPTFFYPGEPPEEFACSDGIDNDGDGLVDYPLDPDCVSATDASESPSGQGGNGTTTPPDPDDSSVCGDGVCNAGENAASCPQDCATMEGATLLWMEDFELGTYERWGWPYEDWSGCASNGLAGNRWVSGSHAQRSQITCAAAESHRGYGLLRFVGDEAVPNFFVPSTGGIDSPHGIVVSFWSWLDAPQGFGFESGRWVSFMTVTDDCSNQWHGVLTVNIDDTTNRLKPVHVDTVTYTPNAPSFPMEQWVRTTVYVNYYDERMFIWQNGHPIAEATFSRPNLTACQFHFGLYASGANSDVVLYEDNIMIWKLDAPLASYDHEPGW